MAETGNGHAVADDLHRDAHDVRDNDGGADHTACTAAGTSGSSSDGDVVDCPPSRGDEPRDVDRHLAYELHDAVVKSGEAPPPPVSWGKGGRRANKGKGQSGASTNARAFFGGMRFQGPQPGASTKSGCDSATANGSCDEDVGGRVGVVAMGVNDPLNVGSIFRLMGCFGADTFTHCHIGRRRPEARDVFTQLQSNTTGHGAVNSSSTNVVGSAVPSRISQIQLEQRVLACEEQMAQVARLIMSVRDGIENVQRRADALGRKLHKKGKVLAKEFWRGGNNASVQFWKLPAIEAEVRKTARGMERMFSPFVSKVIFTSI